MELLIKKDNLSDITYLAELILDTYTNFKLN